MKRTCVQLYALDENDELVQAAKGHKQRNYCCMECGESVRLRGGLHRQAHFFHIRLSPNCKLSAKSERHIRVQEHIRAAFSEGQIFLEKRFPSLNRIADAVYESEKLIFEVQCSPISADEVLQRNADYATMGYEVIWILHDQQYNRQRISSAEISLKFLPHYFTNMNKRGQGLIYDQYDIVFMHIRLKRLQKTAVFVGGAQRVKSPPELPRRTNWKAHIQNDLIDRCAHDEELIKELIEQEQSAQPHRVDSKTWQTGIQAIFRKAYTILFRVFLEKACR